MTVEEGVFFQLRDQLWWCVREWLRTDPGAMLPPDDDLAQELATPTYTVKNGVTKVTDKETLRELLGRSPDKGDALCLTFADDEVQDIPPISMNDLKSIFHALRLVKDETGWGRVTITIKNGKMEDVDTTISKKLTINRNVNGI